MDKLAASRLSESLSVPWPGLAESDRPPGRDRILRRLDEPQTPIRLDAVTLPALGRGGRRITCVKTSTESGSRCSGSQGAGDTAGLRQQAHRRAKVAPGEAFIDNDLSEIQEYIVALAAGMVDQVIKRPCGVPGGLGLGFLSAGSWAALWASSSGPGRVPVSAK